MGLWNAWHVTSDPKRVWKYPKMVEKATITDIDDAQKRRQASARYP